MNEAIIGMAGGAYAIALPFAWIGLAICVLVLAPMAMYQGTREPAGVGFMFASMLFGVTTWLLGAVVTFATYGWVGLLIGLFLFGVGVVPIAIFAAFFTLAAPGLGLSLIVMSIITYGARLVGSALTEG